MRRLLAFALIGALFAIAAITGCGVEAGSSSPVEIPNVVIDCQTPVCKNSTLSPIVYVTYTRSGCENPGFAWEVSGSSYLNCTPSGGCYGTISTWVADNSNTVARTIPSGVYNICVWIDPHRNWPAFPENDTRGELLNQAIGEGSGTRFVTDWLDP